MRLSSFFFSGVFAASILIATGGCSLLSSSSATKDERFCTPGAHVFCRCADRAEGTKLCKPDGKSFEACQTDDSGECVGGEVEDERTNEEVDPPDTRPPSTPTSKPSANELDNCPGKSTGLAPGAEVKLEGDTSAAVNDREGETGGACAVGVGAKDHVYRLVPSGSGQIDVKVQGSGGLNPVAYIRTSCDDKESQRGCGPPSPTKVVSFKTFVKNGVSYFLVVDGASGSAGTYVATIKLTTMPFCGDGKVTDGEACDDDNQEHNDGCGNDCRSINGNPTSGGACPGQPVDIWPNQTVSGEGSTSSYGNTFGNPSIACDGAGANSYQDHIYRVLPHAAGTLVVSLSNPASGPLPNLMLSARKTCTIGSTQGAGMCANDFSNGTAGLETMQFSVNNNEPVYVAVDGGGSTNNKGDYKISFKLQP
jgi:cysteine-rich repeat protein